MRKGISPVVAAVLLVAAAVLIGAIATVFVSSFVGQKTTQAEASGCAVSTQFTISDAQANSTGGIRVKLTNTGSDSVGNFTVEVALSNGTIEREIAADPAQSTNITSGQATYVYGAPWFNADLAGAQSIDMIKVVSGTCKQFYATTDEVTYKTPFG